MDDLEMSSPELYLLRHKLSGFVKFKRFCFLGNIFQ